MSRTIQFAVFVGMLLALLTSSAVPRLSGAEDLRAQIREILRLANHAEKSVASIGVEAAERYRAAAEDERMDPKLRYAFGLALAKGGKYAEANTAIGRAVDQLDGELQLGAMALLAHTKAAQKNYDAAGQQFQQLAETIRAGRDQFDPQHLEELADFTGQTIGFLESLDKGEIANINRIKTRLRDSFPEATGETFDRAAKDVQDEYGRLQQQLQSAQDQLREEQEAKQEELVKSLEEAKKKLAEEEDSLKKDADKDRERLEATRDRLNRDLAAVERQYQALNGQLLTASNEINRLQRERLFYFRRSRLEDGTEVVENINPGAVAQIDRAISLLEQQGFNADLQQQTLLVQARRLIAQGAVTSGLEQRMLSALKEQKDDLKKQSSKIRKREQAARLAKAKDSTTKTITMKNKLRTLSTYVQIPVVAEGKRILQSVPADE